MPATPSLPMASAENRLGAETSPYLLQHKDNPVHWLPWGPEALALARARNRPVLLSIGYAACHWCHVMAHESFEDPVIAALMNDLFIPIKVDREERPDLDQIYQAALALLGQPGGWPLTLFLTPEGEPFWGGTYFPPTARFGRPGFPDVLRGVAATWQQEPDKVTRNVTALREALAGLAESKSAGALDPGMLDTIAERLIREVDPFHGGIGTEPKFPQAAIFELFWRAWKRTGRAPYRNAVVTTLTAMAQGGIYDHLGGGFARYSVDAEWLVPHFEKMLYDNALMIDLLTLVWPEGGGPEERDPLLETRVRETVAWVEREMVAPGGGFASTLDADSEGKEGLFYVWSAAEIDRLLGADAALFKAAYDVTPEGNWEGVTILNRRKRPEPGDAAFEARLAGLRAILWQARERRVRPGWDDKVLADWNGLMIAALANAGFVFAEPSWIAAAARAFAFVRDRMSVDGVSIKGVSIEGRLGHGWRQGQLKHAGTLDDYANMSRAALALFEVTGDGAALDQARIWVDTLDRHFWDRDQGGYFFTADDAESLLVRPKNAHDHATPSGNGTMVGVLTRLYHLTGDSAYGDRAEALIAAFSGEVGRNFFPLATLLNNAEFFYRPLQIVLVGPDTGALKDVVRRRSLPNRLLTTVAPGATLPPGHPAHGKEAVEGRATAYVCTGMTCLAPVTDPAALAARLDQLRE